MSDVCVELRVARLDWRLYRPGTPDSNRKFTPPADQVLLVSFQVGQKLVLKFSCQNPFFSSDFLIMELKILMNHELRPTSVSKLSKVVFLSF